jgi:hypothetical protein
VPGPALFAGRPGSAAEPSGWPAAALPHPDQGTDGGTPVRTTVYRTGPAPSSGVQVTGAGSNTAAATVPASVPIPAGATSATFTVRTGRVQVNTTQKAASERALATLRRVRVRA